MHNVNPAAGDAIASLRFTGSVETSATLVIESESMAADLRYVAAEYSEHHTAEPRHWSGSWLVQGSGHIVASAEGIDWGTAIAWRADGLMVAGR